MHTYDSKINRWVMQDSLTNLFHHHKIDPKWLDINSFSFTSYQSVILLTQLYHDNRIFEELDQDSLIKLLKNKIAETSIYATCHLLRVPSTRLINFYYKVKKYLELGQTFSISLGVGMVLSQLLDDELKARLKECLLNVGVIYHDFVPGSEFDLLWE